MATGYQGGNDAVVSQFFQPMLNTWAKNQAFRQNQVMEERKQRDKLQLEAQKDISKVSANGLREPDRQGFTDRYSNIKDIYFQLGRAQTQADRTKLSMDLNSALGDIEAYVKNSQENAKLYSSAIQGLSSMVGKGKYEEAKSHIQALASKPSSELTRESFDTSNFLYKYDPAKVESSISKVADQVLSNPDNISAGSQIIGGYSTSLGKRMDTVQSTTRAKQPAIFSAISDLAQKDRNVQAYVKDLMDADPTLDYNGAISAIVEQNQNKFVKSSVKDVSAAKPKGLTVNVNTGVTTPAASVIDNYPLGRNPQNGREVTLPKFQQYNQSQEIGGLLKGVDPVTKKPVEAQGEATRARVLGVGQDENGKNVLLIRYSPNPYLEGSQFEANMLVDQKTYMNSANMPKSAKPYVEEVSKNRQPAQQQSSQKAKTPAELMREARNKK